VSGAVTPGRFLADEDLPFLVVRWTFRLYWGSKSRRVCPAQGRNIQSNIVDAARSALSNLSCSFEDIDSDPRVKRHCISRILCSIQIFAHWKRINLPIGSTAAILGPTDTKIRCCCTLLIPSHVTPTVVHHAPCVTP